MKTLLLADVMLLALSYGSACTLYERDDYDSDEYEPTLNKFADYYHFLKDLRNNAPRSEGKENILLTPTPEQYERFKFLLKLYLDLANTNHILNRRYLDLLAYTGEQHLKYYVYDPVMLQDFKDSQQ